MPARRAKRRSTARPAAAAGTGRRQSGAAAFALRSQILLGAAAAFGDKGYADTSVEDILRAAGVSRRTFYRFFGNKDEAFEQLFEAASMLFLQSIRTAAGAGSTPLEKLENCVDVHLRAPQTAGPVFRVLNHEASRPGSKLADRRQAVIDDIVDIFDDEVHALQGHRIDPLVLRGIIAALEHIAMHVFTQTTADEAVLRRAKAAMMRIAASTLATDVDAPVPLPVM